VNAILLKPLGSSPTLANLLFVTRLYGVLARDKLGLDKFFVVSKHVEEMVPAHGRQNIEKLGDVLEAFIAALWIDSGLNFQMVNDFVINMIENASGYCANAAGRTIITRIGCRSFVSRRWALLPSTRWLKTEQKGSRWLCANPMARFLGLEILQPRNRQNRMRVDTPFEKLMSTMK